MRLKLNISPCPNDTFMFHAMLHGLIDTEGLEFDVAFHDIEELNRMLIDGNPQVSKASYAVVPQILRRYAVLRSGSALGRGNGPLLVSADEDADTSDADMHIAVPGLQTTANLLMTKIYPHLTLKQPCLFSDIATLVERGQYDAGVLIHEGRFTYRQHGLWLLADLGKEWESRTGLPLPLGAIVVSRELDAETQLTVERVMRRSVEYAMSNPEASSCFVRSHAQEMDEKVMKSHIELFVNNFSIDLGHDGERSVETLLGVSSSGLFVR